jgi:hypothetical protein
MQPHARLWRQTRLNAGTWSADDKKSLSETAITSDFSFSMPSIVRACRMLSIRRRQPSNGEFAMRKTSAENAESIRTRAEMRWNDAASLDTIRMS